MSKETKEQAETIKRIFEQVKEGSEKYKKQADGFDKELVKKIEKVQEGAQEVVKHIEKKQG